VPFAPVPKGFLARPAVRTNMIRALSPWDAMRITCPSCAATYDVPASRLKPGKLVRCARCGGEWLPVHDAEEVVSSPAPVAEQSLLEAAPELVAPLPTVTAMDRLAASRPRGASRAGLIGAWALTLVVLIGAIAATISWRDAVIRLWPPSGRILAATGQAPQPTRTMDRNDE
jgi:predicted Zn finger-like uncharacterized protein